MRELLITAFEDTVANFKAEAALMPLSRWSEAVFKFLYARAVAEREPDVSQFFECSDPSFRPRDRIDLVLHRNNQRVLLEFKFYVHAKKYDPWSGEDIGWKGGPGTENRGEFVGAVRKLRERSVPSGLNCSKVLALFYADPLATNRESYESYYGDTERDRNELDIRPLVSIGPFGLEGQTTLCHARLYEVGQ